LAWDTNLQRRIAIKEFLPRQLASRASGATQVHPYTGGQAAFNIGLENFLSEARKLAQFQDHPGIISVLDFFPENGTGYMVMEYLDGSTLEQYMTANGSLDTPVVLQLLIPVADALRACHAAGLIHRDISPDNIFVTSDGRVKLLDFGAARFAIGSQSTNLSVILKEGYAPFEQYQRNGKQGPWTDIYALTATLYRLLTGDLPVTAPDRVAGTPLPPPSEKGVKLPPGLPGLLDKGLAIRSEHRYQTIDGFLSDLKAVLGTAPPHPPPTPAGRRRRLVVTLVGAIGLLGGAAVLFWPPPPLQDATVRPNPPPPLQDATVRPNPPPPLQDATVRPNPPPSLQDATVRPNPPPPLQDATVRPNPPPPLQDATVRPNPPPSLQDATVRLNPPPRVSPATSIDSMREYVKQAAQHRIQLELAKTQARGASNVLDKLRAIPTKTEGIQNSIQTQENMYNSAVRDQESVLRKYMADVEWLGEHDEAGVDAAVKLESDAANAPTIDKGEAEGKAQIGRAIKLLANHVRAQRQNQLTREKVINDAY
jgi:serine/threonine protein kinase